MEKDVAVCHKLVHSSLGLLLGHDRMVAVVVYYGICNVSNVNAILVGHY